MTTLYRSNVEATKRVFLDRLTTDQQSLAQPDNLDAGPGDEYVYANVGDSNNFGIGFDCSGLVGVLVKIALYGLNTFAGIGYQRIFSTETFADWAIPLGFRQTTQADLVAGNYPIKVCIANDGGGENSHMNMSLDGIVMESNGDSGICTMSSGATPLNSSYWNHFYVFDGPIKEDTPYRTPMHYPRGLDYAGGYISGKDLAAQGISFVCRYVASGGTGLPDKLLTPDEFTDLVANDIAVVFNWETTSDFMLNGYNQGVSDAQASLSYIRSLPGVGGTFVPTVYFSADFDEAPDQDVAVDQYLKGAASVLGMSHVGIYGAYWICTRAQAAVGVPYIWQTEAWSGGNITSAVNIMQRNNAGYQTINGVQCDINEAHSDDFGQYAPKSVVPPPSWSPPDLPPLTPGEPGPVDNDMLSYIYGQLQPYPQLAGKADAMAALKAKIDAGVDLTLVDALAGHIWGLLYPTLLKVDKKLIPTGTVHSGFISSLPPGSSSFKVGHFDTTAKTPARNRKGRK